MPTQLYGFIASTLLVNAPCRSRAFSRAVCAILLFWRVYLTANHHPLPARGLLMVTVACVLGILISFKTLFGRDAGVTLLLLLSALC
jgi:hypothetical protein